MSNNDLFKSLKQVKNNAIGSIVTVSKVTLTGGKKNPFQGRIIKRCSGGSVMFFGNSKSNGYLNMKKRIAEKNGLDSNSIENKKRPWGTRMKDCPLVMHKGKVYAELVYLHAPTKTEYFIDGIHPIVKSDIDGLPNDRSDKNAIALRCPKLSTIKTLKMGKLSVNV